MKTKINDIENRMVVDEEWEDFEDDLEEIFRKEDIECEIGDDRYNDSLWD